MTPRPSSAPPMVSVVLPCLNEANTVAACVQEAQQSLREIGKIGEIIVADNGSSDGSGQLAQDAGATVVHCPTPGYGAALRCGIAKARGKTIIMADADRSYDLSNLKAFIEPIEQGADIVIGNRFAGGIQPGAMPWKNRHLGNPALTKLLNFLFQQRLHDAHCGLRSFSREAYERLETQSSGMEFASELLVKAALLHLRIVEVPTILRRDGRNRAPHLLPWRDGWRHVCLLFSLAPAWIYIVPGSMLSVLGLAMIFSSRLQGRTSVSLVTLATGAWCIIHGFAQHKQLKKFIQRNS